VELDALFDKHMPLAGDREYGDDEDLVVGVAWVSDRRCVFIAAQESPATPAAYGKAARMVRLAQQTAAPCVLVGAAVALHLEPPEDPRSAAAFDAYLTALASAGGRRVAVTDATPAEGLADAFDAVVSRDGAEALSTVRSDLASALAGVA